MPQLAANHLVELATYLESHLNFGGQLKQVANPDQTLKSKGGLKGLMIYKELKRDPTYNTARQKRKQAVIGWELVVEPATDAAIDVQAADALRENLDNLAMPSEDAQPNGLLARGIDGICEGLLEAIFKGFAVGEIVWERTTEGIRIKAIKIRDQTRFVFAISEAGHFELKLRTKDQPVYGESLPDRKFIIHRVGDDDDNPYGDALDSALFWVVFFKKQIQKFWLKFAERHGSPSIVATAPETADDTELSGVLGILDNAASQQNIVLRAGWLVDTLQAASAANIETFDSFCEYLDRESSKLILGETGTTDQQGDGGSRARDQVGNEVRLERVQADSDLLGETLTATISRWFCDYNYPNANPPRIYRKPIDKTDLLQAAEIDLKLRQMGYKRPIEEIRRVYGGDYVEVETIPAAPTFAELGSNSIAQFTSPRLDVPQQITARSEGLMAELSRQFWQTAAREWRLSQGYAEFSERMTAALGGLYTPDIVDGVVAELARYLEAGRLAGVIEAQGDDGSDN